ncbi:MAG: phytoene desaturase [Chitinophagia bacterium]|nr:phytoene desaturase [Chitinophagia bacterium]
MQPVSSVVRKLFKDYRLIALLEFPVLFLGASAKHIPALYTLMNYAALELGTWYPMGGMVEIVRGMESLARELGVKITTDCAVQHITTGADGYVSSLETTLGRTPTDAVIASADYHHVEQQLLDAPLRRYNEPYWDKRALAPSCVIYYLGINRKLDKLIHHNLFFDADMDQHIDDIYTQPEWPENPLFYACCPSKTDSSVAPVGMENLFILIPVAAGMKENEQLLDRYYDIAMARLEKYCGHSIKEHVVVRHNYSTQNFTADYNAYKGNAYGLANTLAQTAVLKPSLRNKKIKNMFYAGQLTVPGPGVPPALISGKIAAQQIDKLFKNTRP